MAGKKQFSLLCYGLMILVITLLIAAFILSQQYSYPRYNDARLIFSTDEVDLQRKFAVQQGAGKFLFAARAQNSVSTSLHFKSTTDLIIRTKTLYERENCSENSIGKTFIIFTTPVQRIKHKLTEGLHEFKISVLADDRVKVNLENSIKINCGKATIWLEQEQHILRYLIIFAVTWIGFVFLLSMYKLEFLAVGGAIIHASIIVSEFIYLGPNQTQIALGMQISMAAVGFSLIPLATKTFRSVSFAIFIIEIFVLIAFSWGNIINFIRFEAPIEGNSIHAILQSNLSESIQFITSSFPPLIVVGTCIIVLLLSSYICFAYKKVIPSPMLTWLGLFLIAGPIYFYPSLLQQLATFSTWSKHSNSYFRELRSYNKLASQRKIDSQNYQLTQNGSPRTTILVLGESHNKNHMSLYGYPRKTTPNLDLLATEKQLVVFKNAYSNHTHTDPALTLALTKANQYQTAPWISSPSLIDIANAMSISTYWISNQQMLGAWDNQVALIAKGAGNLISINKKIGIYRQPNRYDEALLTPLGQSVSNYPEQKLIVIHLFGSHATYCFRYPENKTIYNSALKRHLFGNLARSANSEKINCYDNSIAYNDQILDKLFTQLDSSDFAASVLYVSDHSEDVITGKAHNQANFVYPMAEIPMLFWANKRWKNESKPLWEQLNRNRNKLFTNDLVFETVLGIMGIQGKEIDKKNDLSSDDYIAPNPALSLHGRIDLNADNNVKLWQRKNISELVKLGLSKRIIPHRVNTIGKMQDLTEDEMTSFEIDIVFQEDNESGNFQVGHDSKNLSGMTLESYLEKIPNNFGKIWLDVKNITEKNIDKIVGRLEKLDIQFEIKDRIIVETSNKSAAPRILSKNGYHLSYYLPTKDILSVMNESQETQQQFAEQLKELIDSQTVSAVSFDLKLYEFVKNFLEPLIDSNIEYHTWFPGFKYSEPEFLNKLHSSPYFGDDRIKTILIPYFSLFSL